MERLLATWRHLFKNGGWKSLDGLASTKPEAKKEMEKKMAQVTWNYFVDEVVLKDTFVNKSEVELDNFDGMGNWVKHHWAPYWWVVKFVRTALCFQSRIQHPVQSTYSTTALCRCACHLWCFILCVTGTLVESARRIIFQISS